MKQIVSNYSYSPTTNVVTLTGVNIDADQLLLIVAPEVGRTMYNFASVTGTVSAGANTRVTLNASTVGLTTTSPLVIFYDDQAGAQSVTGTVALDPASLIALENVTVTVGSSVSISNFPTTQTIAGTVTVSNKVQVIPDLINPLYSVITSGSAIRVYDTYGQDISVNTDNGGINASLVNSVTIGSLPAISGTVTANVPLSVDEYTATTGIRVTGCGVDGGLRVQGIDPSNFNPANLEEGGGIPIFSVSNNPLPISGTVTANIGNSSAASAGFVKICGEVAGGAPSDPKEIITDSQGMLYARIAPSNSLTSDPVKYDPVLGDAYINVRQYTGTSVTIGSLPAISGSVTIGAGTAQIGSVTASISGTVPISISSVTVGNSVTIGSLPAIIGTVTVSSLPASTVTVSSLPSVSGTVTVSGVSSTVTARLINPAGSAVTYAEVGTAGSPSIDVLSIQGVSGGTNVPVRFPRVTLIDGSGTVVTANSAVTLFASSTTRSYLLVQVTTGSAFVNVGATATTVNGLSLSAGQVYSWENTIPQGLVSLISTVTSSRWVAKEA